MPLYSPRPFRINNVTTQVICWVMVPVAQTEVQSSTNSLHNFLAPMWFAPVSRFSAFFAPRSHALMCSAQIPDAPLHWPWLSWETVVLSSPSDGGASAIGKGVPLAGNPTLYASLSVYNSSCLTVCRSIVRRQGLAWVSKAFWYHPFRWWNASWTFPLLSSDTMLSPTLEVSQLLLALSAACTLHFICRAAACLIFPLGKREARFTISFHLPLLIQSFPGGYVVLGSTHLGMRR